MCDLTFPAFERSFAQAEIAVPNVRGNKISHRFWNNFPWNEGPHFLQGKSRRCGGSRQEEIFLVQVLDVQAAAGFKAIDCQA